MEPVKRRCVVMPVETDERYSVRGLINEGYVRVQSGKNDFFIPANVFRKAAFTLKVGHRLEEPPITVERLKDTDDGRKRLGFTVTSRSGEPRNAVIEGETIEEIVERIDQVKALLHTYYGTNNDASDYDSDDADQAEA